MQEFRVVLVLTANTVTTVSADEVKKVVEEEFTEWTGGGISVEDVEEVKEGVSIVFYRNGVEVRREAKR